jgi:hypothetical protein
MHRWISERGGFEVGEEYEGEQYPDEAYEDKGDLKF